MVKLGWSVYATNTFGFVERLTKPDRRDPETRFVKLLVMATFSIRMRVWLLGGIWRDGKNGALGYRSEVSTP